MISFKDYVDTPVPITFKLDRQNVVKSFKKSISFPASVVPGLFYAIRTDSTALEGYMICRVLASIGKEFQALYYKKREMFPPDEVSYEETIVSYMMNQDSILGQLVSAHLKDRVLYVNAVEIEELIISSLDFDFS